MRTSCDFRRACGVVLLALLAIPCAPPSARAQQPVVLVHGGNTTADTWSNFATRLRSTGIYQPYAYQTAVGDPIASQASTLLTDMANDGIGDDAILVAHSQGGLVSRYATLLKPVKGLITIGTPHQGMGLAVNWENIRWNLSMMDFDVFAIMVLDNPYLWWENPIYWNQGRATSWAMWAEEAVIIASAIVINDKINRAERSASWDELAPGSPFLQIENAITWAERPRYRASIQSDIGAGYGAGPLRLATEDPEGVAEIERDLYWGGAELIFTGFDLMWEMWDNEFGISWWDLLFGSAACIDLGIRMLWFGDWWVDMVGGYPHDGIVPTSSMYYPWSASYSLSGIVHTRETSSNSSMDMMQSLVEQIRQNP